MAAKTPLSIRGFKREDINKILEIEAEAFPKTAYSRKMFIEYAKNRVNTFIVLETDEDIAGYMIFDEGGHIHSTAVKSVCRRKGFGKKLFSHALGCCKNRLWLEVRSSNIVALEFYRSMDMEIAGKIPGYYGNDDAFIMVVKSETG